MTEISHRSETPADSKAAPRLAARLGLFDATMVVMGGIIGSGIFINPYVVAKLVHTPALILGAWIAGGVLALIGAFIYAELADRMPEVGGQYAYLSEAYHPALGISLRLGGIICYRGRRNGGRGRHVCEIFSRTDSNDGLRKTSSR